jgi:alanyl-tRNA synthetase
MTSSEIRNSFLKFFEERAHTIVPSAPVVPYDDPTLLFANAGMNQFKDVFLGTGKRSYTRATDTQKCIRVSGKHNDLEEVGRDTYHHTFFEMLGNWSFGDYYKKEAIEWAWELLTKVWGLPKNRLWATVYKDDQEAEQLWKSATDIDPNHILRFGEKDNFWEMGETGPCGPCSEIHIDRTPDGTATASMVNAGVAEVMEIWNLVFIQYNRDEAGKLSPLPAKHVDTGMGFERVCAVLQGKNSNYDTDVFTPIINKISSLTKTSYDGRLTDIPQSQIDLDTAMRVITDHVRTLTFAIGDGSTPSNEGRGYVLRRILRRAARFGRNLGMHEPFIYQLVPTLVETMSYIFPEIKTNQEHIQRVIKGEEESFNATLDRGLEKFEDVVKQIGDSKTFPGEDAFKLYDTFGFPLDLTELMATERGLKVNTEIFNKSMNEQKKRSRETKKFEFIGGPVVTYWLDEQQDTEFKNIVESKLKDAKFEYEALEVETKIMESQLYYTPDKSENKFEFFLPGLILEKTTFYVESGGQLSDTGCLEFNFSDKHVDFEVLSLDKRYGKTVHIVDISKYDPHYIFNQYISIKTKIDIPRRLSIMRNHSATHLLHNALRKILGTHVQQAGSLVAPDYFRFDFSHFAKLSEQELTDIEALVNEKIKENLPRTPGLNNIPFEDAKKMGALMFFGDKYGERVNVVQFGDFSTEFCGGTHVNNTGEIGYFKIRSEGSVASGVRRIEGVTHNYALDLLKLQDKSYFDRLDYAFERLDEISNLKSELATVSNGKSNFIHDSFGGFEQRLEDLKHITPIPDHASIELASCFDQLSHRNQVLEELLMNLADEKKLFEKELARFRLKSLSGSMDELISSAVSVDNIKLIAVKVSATSMDELKSLGDSLRAKLGSGVGVLASVIEDKVQLVCVVTDDLVAAKKIEASKVVGAVAKIVGGGGGGRPHMATAGGKDIAKIDEAISHTKSIVESLLKK